MNKENQPYAAARQRVLDFHLNTEANWDGLGGLPACARTHSEALGFLSMSEEANLPKPSGVTLSASGAISVVWKFNDLYLTNQFFGRGRYTLIGVGMGPQRSKEVISEKITVGELPDKLVKILLARDAQNV